MLVLKVTLKWLHAYYFDHHALSLQWTPRLKINDEAGDGQFVFSDQLGRDAGIVSPGRA